MPHLPASGETDRDSARMMRLKLSDSEWRRSPSMPEARAFSTAELTRPTSATERAKSTTLPLPAKNSTTPLPASIVSERPRRIQVSRTRGGRPSCRPAGGSWECGRFTREGCNNKARRLVLRAGTCWLRRDGTSVRDVGEGPAGDGVAPGGVDPVPARGLNSEQSEQCPQECLRASRPALIRLRRISPSVETGPSICGDRRVNHACADIHSTVPFPL